MVTDYICAYFNRPQLFPHGVVCKKVGVRVRARLEFNFWCRSNEQISRRGTSLDFIVYAYIAFLFSEIKPKVVATTSYCYNFLKSVL